MPAVRRPFVAKPGGGKPAGLVARREGSSSWCGGRYEYPPELKPLFIEVMLTVCILAHMSVLCDEPLFIACDDLKAWFHQFATAVLQRWACNIFTLDPEARREEVAAAAAAVDGEVSAATPNAANGVEGGGGARPRSGSGDSALSSATAPLHETMGWKTLETALGDRAECVYEAGWRSGYITTVLRVCGTLDYSTVCCKYFIHDRAPYSFFLVPIFSYN